MKIEGETRHENLTAPPRVVAAKRPRMRQVARSASFSVQLVVQ